MSSPQDKDRLGSIFGVLDGLEIFRLLGNMRDYKILKESCEKYEKYIDERIP